MKPNPLLIIAVIFAVSFAGRAVGFANAAIKETASDKQKAAALDAESFSPVNVQDAAVSAVIEDAKIKDGFEDHTPDDEAILTAPLSSAEKAARNATLLEAIRERSAQLDRKALEVEDRIRRLEIIETRIETKLAELKRNNEDLSKLVSYASEASQKDISLLARMYGQMKPQRAAEIFDKMHPTFAAGFLTEMEAENAALILGNMSTEKAYETSMIIASRNAAAAR